jgi:hypothetical protein
MFLLFSVPMSNNNFHAGLFMEINDWLKLMDQRATPPRQSLISRNALNCNCNSLNKNLQENSKRNARPVHVTTEQMAVSIANKSPKGQIICVSIVLLSKMLCSIYNFLRCQCRIVFLQDSMQMELS